MCSCGFRVFLVTVHTGRTKSEAGEKRGCHSALFRQKLAGWGEQGWAALFRLCGCAEQTGADGYTSVEAANYADGKFYGRAPEDFRKDVESAGMQVLSSHCSRMLTEEELASGDLTEALEWWDRCIADHKAAGMKYIVFPWLGVPDTMKDLALYCRYLDEIGKRCKAQGILFGYHNHAHEFQKVEGQEVMYDYMLQYTNPECVFFQMDVYWVVRGQNSPVDYFNKYPGRFKMLHIKDHREIGQSGMVGYDAIFRNIGTAGAEDIVAEIENYSTSDVLKSVEESMNYLLDASFVKASYRK